MQKSAYIYTTIYNVQFLGRMNIFSWAGGHSDYGCQSFFYHHGIRNYYFKTIYL